MGSWFQRVHCFWSYGEAQHHGVKKGLSPHGVSEAEKTGGLEMRCALSRETWPLCRWLSENTVGGQHSLRVERLESKDSKGLTGKDTVLTWTVCSLPVHH